MPIYQLKTFSDLYTAAMEEMKIQSTDVTSKNRIKRNINAIYLEEVVPYAPWPWRRKEINVSHEAYINTGTVAVTEGSVTATLSSAPSISCKGYLFTIPGKREVYRVAQHTAAATTLTLDVPYTGDTNASASYKLWRDRVVLPPGTSGVYQVTHAFQDTPLGDVGLGEYREYMAVNPTLEGPPALCTLGDLQDPDPYQTISSLPALSTRASAGLVKTLVFATTVATLLEEGDRIQISGAGHYSYNGEWIVSSVSTTTVTFTGLVPYVESATADATLVVKKLRSETSSNAYRELLVYPSLSDTRLTLTVDRFLDVAPLEDDSDEPLMPLEDRIVLLYGTLSRDWRRERDSEDAATNYGLYQQKLVRMASRLKNHQDYPTLSISKTYLAAKRRVTRAYRNWKAD